MRKPAPLVCSFLAYTLALQTLSAESCTDEEESYTPRMHHLSVSHRQGAGIGYSKGYTSLNAFFSIPSHELVPFFDFRAHVFNDGKWAANAGLGIRKLLCNSWILGGNAFYDYRHTSHTTFNQVGFGLELLGTKWDLHGNAYIPVGHNRRNYANFFKGFEGHSAVFTRKYEFAFAGADILAGREFWSLHDSILRGAIGAYFLKGHFNQKAGGGLFKLTADINRYVHFEAQLSYDNIFKWRPQAELRVNIPIGKKVRLNRCDLNRNKQDKLSFHMTSSVDRFEIIPKDHKKRKAIAQNPITGQPFYFIFVDNLRGHSDGSFENPFATLLEAQNGSQPNDVIYVFPGDGTTKGMNMGITLQQGQYFIGSSVALQASVKGIGPVIIPPQSIISPTISNTNAGGNTVTLPNGTGGYTISGFIIEAPNGSGIFGGSMTAGPPQIDTVTITDNQFINVSQTSTTSSVFLGNITGIINIHNNVDNGNGISITTATSGSSNIYVTKNIIACAGPTTDQDIGVRSQGTQSMIFIDGNNLSLADIGIAVLVTSSSITNIVTSNNNCTNVDIGIALSFTDSPLVSATTINNTVSQTAEQGLLVLAENNTPIYLDIQRNTILQSSLIANVAGVEIDSLEAAQITLRLLGNSSFPANTSAPGYLLNNGSSPVTPFYVESPNLALTGVQRLI